MVGTTIKRVPGLRPDQTHDATSYFKVGESGKRRAMAVARFVC
jgi:hypothetical protein